MTRSEKTGLVLVAVLAGLFVATVALGAADRLNRHPWFGSGANVIQWSSGAATFAALAAMVAGYLNRRCAVRACFRFGEHPVDGCLEKVCHRHHTRAHHEDTFARFGEDHAQSGRLARGESHGAMASESRCGG